MIEKPKIRPVEALPVDQNGQTYVMLRDPASVAAEPILIGTGAYFLVTLFDGNNTRLDIQAAFTRRFGDLLPSQHLDGLIEALDQGYFLDSPRYADRTREIHEAFARAPHRPAVLAGLAYDNDPTRLRAEITSYFTR